MKYVALAAAIAVVGLTACSTTTAPAAAPSHHQTVSVPVSCHQQYHAWQRGPGRGLVAALRTVSTAGAAGKHHALKAALRKARPAVARAIRHPVPACADPRGYWSVLLMHVNAAVASRHSSSGVRAAMKGVAKIEHELTAELESATR